MTFTIIEKIKHKWNELKCNWDEYQKLRRVVGRAWHKLDSVRGKITVLYRNGETVARKSCIRTKIVCVPQVFQADEMNGRVPSLVMLDDYCPYFKKEGDDVSVRPCAQTQCPCHPQHCEYATAAAEYMAATKKQREFWANANSREK